MGEDAAWIERLVVATSNPDTAGTRKDALGDLQRMIASAAHDTGLQAQLAAELGEFARKLPHDIRAEADDPLLRAAIDGDQAHLIALVGNHLTARLEAEKV
jgi:hypothetical protein